MKKVSTIFAAVMMIASVSFAQMSKTAGKSHRALLQATRFAPAKLVKNVATLNGLKVSGNPIWDNTMSYCLDADFYSGVGTEAPGDTIYWAIKIESAALDGRNNLTDVEFFVVSAGNYTLQIFSGAQPTGTALFNQSIVATAADTMEWKTVHFTSPIAIDQTQDLWIVLSNSDVNYPAAGVTGNEYDNGKWVSLDGIQWMNVANAGVDVTWMIRAISDTYTVLPPVLDLQGPTAVRTSDTAYYYAASGNADSFEWTVTADYLDTTISNVAVVLWETAGTQQVIVTATNTAGSVSDTIDVNVFSCDDITIPYAPNFDDGLGCWDSRSDSIESGWYASVDMFDNNPEGQVLSFSAQNYYGIWMVDFSADNWLFSPEMEMPASGEYEIAWQVKPYDPTYAGDHYGVYVINDGDTILLFEESLTGMTDYNQRMAIIPDSISGDFKVAFRHFNSEGGYVIILDSIEVRGLTAPYLTLVGPIAAENGTVATFTAIAPNASNFEWAINGTPVDATGNVLTNTFTTNGYHTVAVTATNSVGSTVDSISVEIYSCDGVTEFPYTQGFETGLRCWTMVSADSANDDRFGLDTTHYTGSYGFRFSSYSRAADYNQYLISPELTLPETGEYMVKFMYKGHSTHEHFRVLASSTTNDVAAFTTVLGEYTATSMDWTEVAFLLPQNTKYIAIDYFAEYQYYLYVDDITVKVLDIVPTVTVEGPISAESGETVTFVANAPLATSFTWTVDGNPANTTTNSLSTSFTSAGNHTVSVVATNSVGNSTPATATINVYSCDPITEFPWTEDFEENHFDCWKFYDEDGDGDNWFVYFSEATAYGHNNSHRLAMSASYDNNYGPLTPDNWMVLPAMSLPEGSELILSWYEKGQDTAYFAEKYSVYISTTGARVEDFTAAAGNFTSTKNWVGRNIDLSQYAGQTIYIAFRHHDCTDMFYLNIDDIKISTERVSINEVESNMITLYPNPASEMVSINAEGIEGKVTVQILDLTGRVMMQQDGTAQNFRFDVSNLTKGSYFVRMNGENINAVRKLVVR